MPVRLLREGILSSDRVDQLDAPAEVFYRRLMSVVDDHGLYDARPAMLRSSLYPLRVDRVREADISRWIAACEKAGLIALYTHDGKPYLQMLNTRWQARSQPKFPLPTDDGCEQVQTGAHLDVFVVEDVVEERKAREPRATRFDPKTMSIPDWLPRDVWVSWCADRADRRKPITERGAAGQIAKLDLLRGEGHSPKAVIEHCIANGYQGLFPPSKQAQTPANLGTRGVEEAEEHRRKMEERARETPEALAARLEFLAKTKRIAA